MSDYIIGLTGGVASGKSAVAARFEALGVTVADADVAAREAVAVGSGGLAEVVAAFGPEVLGPDGALDRAAMRRRVFNDDAQRLRLEAIVHPRVRAAMRGMCEAAPGPYAVAAIPLLAEGGGLAAYPWLHRILVVDVPDAVQLARLLGLRVDGPLEPDNPRSVALLGHLPEPMSAAAFARQVAMALGREPLLVDCARPIQRVGRA